MIFEGKIHTGVMQDKYPPGRISAASREPATATVVADLNPRVNTKQDRSPSRRITAPNTTAQKLVKPSRLPAV